MNLANAMCCLAKESNLKDVQRFVGAEPDNIMGPKTYAASLIYLIDHASPPRVWLQRNVQDDTGTVGRLAFGQHTGANALHTVERPWRDNAPFESCIPKGDYIVHLDDSPRFGPDTPHIEIVEGRRHILIHAANEPKDVEGCIGLGFHRMHGQMFVQESRRACRRFREWLKDAGGAALMHIGGGV